MPTNKYENGIFIQRENQMDGLNFMAGSPTTSRTLLPEGNHFASASKSSIQRMPSLNNGFMKETSRPNFGTIDPSAKQF